ncbi:FAD-dependent oxidoreductase [Candidatus Saccharibacteria bacterium]|nr:FAD-dependent oxidoreductase [Candidatus Saccharibacteria bacterium]
MKITLEYIENLSSDTKTFWFKKPPNFSYIAGQFIELYLPHKADDRGQKRWFTLSSAPSNDLISITTKVINKPSSFKNTLNKLQPGDEIEMSDTMGDFVLPRNKDIPLVFVAGGIGITPFHSMLSELASKKQKRNITLIYAANDKESLVFENELAKNCKLLPLLSDPPKDWTGLSGKLSADRIINLVDIKNSTRVYLSGPEKMVEAITRDLKTKVNPENVITDYFPGYNSL